MKKLMFALVAGVAATVATAAPITTSSFESGEFAAGSSPTNNALFTYASSSSSEDGSIVKAYASAEAPEAPALDFTGSPSYRYRNGEFTNAGDQFLSLSTDGGTLYRSITAPENSAVVGAAQTVTQSLYIDTLVQFTVCDSAPEIDNNAKLAIWLQASDDETTTNLMVKAKQWTVANVAGVLSGTSTAAVYKINGTYKAGTWYRLTVEDLGNVFTRSGYGATGFRILIDGERVGTAQGVAFYCAGGTDATAALTGFVDDVANFTQYGRVFMSLADSDDELQVANYTSQLCAVGFSGTGAVDNIMFTNENPFYVAPTSLDFTLTLGANISSVTYSIDGGAEVTVTETAHIGSVNTGSAISLTIAPASSTWRTYTPSVAAGDNVTVSGTTVTLNTITLADPNQTTAGATVSAVDSSAAVEDAAGVAAAFTALGVTNEGVTENITTPARYRDFLTWAENNNYNVARINGYADAYTRFNAGLPIEMWVYVTTNTAAVAGYDSSVVGASYSETIEGEYVDTTIYGTKYSVDAGTSLTLSNFTFAAAGENKANLLDGDSANWTYNSAAYSGLDSVTVNAASNGVVLATAVNAASAKVGIATVEVSTAPDTYDFTVTFASPVSGVSYVIGEAAAQSATSGVAIPVTVGSSITLTPAASSLDLPMFYTVTSDVTNYFTTLTFNAAGSVTIYAADASTAPADDPVAEAAATNAVAKAATAAGADGATVAAKVDAAANADGVSVASVATWLASKVDGSTVTYSQVAAAAADDLAAAVGFDLGEIVADPKVEITEVGDDTVNDGADAAYALTFKVTNQAGTQKDVGSAVADYVKGLVKMTSNLSDWDGSSKITDFDVEVSVNGDGTATAKVEKPAATTAFMKIGE